MPIIDNVTGETDDCPICDVHRPPPPKSLCLFCDSKIRPEEAAEHDRECKTRLDFFEGKGDTFERCAPIQV